MYPVNFTVTNYAYYTTTMVVSVGNIYTGISLMNRYSGKAIFFLATITASNYLGNGRYYGKFACMYGLLIQTVNQQIMQVFIVWLALKFVIG